MCSATASESGFRLFPHTRPTLSMRYNRSVTPSNQKSPGEGVSITTSTRPGLHQPGIDGGRRCQSAHARQSAPRSDRIKQARSHSQEPKTTTGVLPIPQTARLNDPSESHVERSDLTRMYDYATWNMYERIVNARRQRLSWLDAQQKLDKEGSAATTPTADTLSLGADNITSPEAMDGELNKAHSRGDSFVTSTTVDDVESDKSSTTLSSASSSVSNSSLPGTLKKTVFSLGAVKASLNQEMQGHSEETEEHFIFEMDM
ncbi:hypothetical protein ACHAWO_002799 [Cyclotella atomus]|uniref:Uncharacterized protein n=1 Tax=Cyclotella atomus TaxID=382360 RepID=A0ABD3PNC5_9STRA